MHPAGGARSAARHVRRRGRGAPGQEQVDNGTMAGVSQGEQVIDNPGESRFELRAGGRLAELRYRVNGHRLVLIHTEVPAELEGRGLGGQLVRAAVDRAVRDGMTVVPMCPFARGWLERHPDVAGQLTIDWGPGPAS